MRNNRFFSYLNLGLIALSANMLACGDEFGDELTSLDSETGTAAIVGGQEVTPHSYPFLVRLSMGCGGSLIDESWVVTAAHCVEQTSPSSVTVRLGEHNLSQQEAGEVSRGVSRIVIHPEYFERGAPIADIALLQLSSPVELSDTIQTIRFRRRPLPTRGDIRVIGWGRTVTGPRGTPGGRTNVPLEIDLPLVSSASFCQESSSILCAGVGRSNEDSCYGDSGGPLFSFRRGDRPVLRALVSDGSPNCDGSSRNTRVSFFAQWIRDTTGI